MLITIFFPIDISLKLPVAFQSGICTSVLFSSRRRRGEPSSPGAVQFRVAEFIVTPVTLKSLIFPGGIESISNSSLILTSENPVLSVTFIFTFTVTERIFGVVQLYWCVPASVLLS